MARTVKDSALGTRESRLKLKARKRYWKGIHFGLALCYRRGNEGSGSWSARIRLPEGEYCLRQIGIADDYADSDGLSILNFSQAQKKALELESKVKSDNGVFSGKVTIAEAAEHYLKWFREHRKSIRETESNINAHILPALGNKVIENLKAKDLRDWHDKLAERPARVRTSRFSKSQNLKSIAQTSDQKRARKATANRILNILKAILNKAFHDGYVPDDKEWRKVLPYKKVDEARIRFLTDTDAVKLVNNCDEDLRKLVRGALLTGGRYSELANLKVKDVNIGSLQICFAISKSGRTRYVPLNSEGATLFKELVKGKASEEYLFIRSNGQKWGKNHHIRPLKEACSKKNAKISPTVLFHELRHTYASHLAQAGIDLLTISKLLGHADTRITSKHYAHLTDKTLAAAVESLPSFSKDRSSLLTSINQSKAKIEVKRA